jgi:pimeloyl-ACP methyl ester carboxylesterase
MHLKRLPSAAAAILAAGGWLGLATGLAAAQPPEATPAPAPQSAASAPLPAGEQRTGFSDYTPLAGNAELVRRMLSPLGYVALQRRLAGAGDALSGYPVDLAAERFLVYVPAHSPPASSSGYGLMVFIPPWNDARLPEGWNGVLDRLGMIFASAARSGNDAPDGRREALALLAAYNVMRRSRVDPARVFVAGFSGGSRIAMRLALAYPDLFDGALLNAGSDPIGSREVPLPPRELFLHFQDSSRLVYLTGERDTTHLAMDAASLESMRRWCVFDVVQRTTPWTAHEAASAAALARALEALAAPAPQNRAKLDACRAAAERRLTQQLEEVQALETRGERAQARQRLEALDQEFGGLAAPRSVVLAAALD